ncbi:hypothetical protein Vi05172_g9312 [Venturia inaequalis]|uniref:Uncharacterized protein n=1 Tax=Venturia inaequalis TaxID=5025 RepID=A0A8H3V5Y3_VENIN|nr:hypothetical protein EG327_005984 [Venturia inaequalis]RDI80677.1 hypothetical protein Vi05172_g9312 [Venturia inaequalis]
MQWAHSMRDASVTTMERRTGTPFDAHSMAKNTTLGSGYVPVRTARPPLEDLALEMSMLSASPSIGFDTNAETTSRDVDSISQPMYGVRHNCRDNGELA